MLSLFLFKNNIINLYMSETNTNKESGETKIDYLSVDNEISGQKFCCISFCEPSVDKLSHKESYIFNHFVKQFSHILYLQWCKHHKISPDSELEINNQEIYDRYTDFKAIKYKELCEQYQKETNNENHTRIVKVRGSYNSLDEAKAKAKRLRVEDEQFDVFVGQVGAWIPFNPVNINDVSPEYIEEKMQDLVKTHIQQEQHKEEIFNKRKNDMIEQVKVDNKKEGAIQLLENTNKKKKVVKNKLPDDIKTKLQKRLLESQSKEDNITKEDIETFIDTMDEEGEEKEN